MPRYLRLITQTVERYEIVEAETPQQALTTEVVQVASDTNFDDPGGRMVWRINDVSNLLGAVEELLTLTGGMGLPDPDAES